MYISDDKELDVCNSPMEFYLYPGQTIWTFWTFVIDISTATWWLMETLSIIGLYSISPVHTESYR